MKEVLAKVEVQLHFVKAAQMAGIHPSGLLGKYFETASSQVSVVLVGRTVDL
jgi:hypothetical protein